MLKLRKTKARMRKIRRVMTKRGRAKKLKRARRKRRRISLKSMSSRFINGIRK